MNKNLIIGILVMIIAILAVGHIEWHNLYLKQLEDIKKYKTDYSILKEDYEQEEEKLLNAYAENEVLKEELINLEHSKTEILEYEYIGEYTITAYCCEKYPHICGGGNTATGVPPTPELTCAVCDLQTMPYGTIIYIEGIGIRVVQDTGGFHGAKIDVAVAKHEEAVKWQTKKHKVWLIK